jgi:hypothetical protein
MRQLGVLVGLLAAGCQIANDSEATQAVACPQNQCPPPQTLTVPTDFPTIQAAIDQSSDGATIQILRGTYREHLVIAGKRLRIVGGPRVTLRSRDAQLPLVAYSQGGGGSLEDLALHPSGDGIVGISDGQTGPSDLVLLHVDIERGEMAIAGTFAGLVLDHVDVRRSKGAEVAMFSSLATKYSKFFDMSDAFKIVDNSAGAACPITLDHVDARRNDGGGLAIIGSACSVEITASSFVDNRIFGVALADTGAVTITDSTASFTRPRVGGGWGDGVVLIRSGPVVIDGSILSNNARAGFSEFGCPGGVAAPTKIVDSIVACDAFPFEDEAIGGCDSLYTGVSGDTCDCGDKVVPCHSASVGDAPPAVGP